MGRQAAIVRHRGVDVTVWRLTAWHATAIGVAVGIAAGSSAELAAQSTMSALSSAPSRPIVLVDASGSIAARPLNETIMLVTIGGSVIAPALIRPILDADGRAASGLATWQSGGSVLFTSADCSTGAHVYSSAPAGVRAATQVLTARGIVLFAGAIGPTVTEAIQSILYDNGCVSVAVRQNGLVPVVTSVNLTTTYRPPLSFQ